MITFSVFGSPETLTKTYFTENGVLKAKGASNYVNLVSTVSLPTLRDVLDHLGQLSSTQCVGWGIAHPEIIEQTVVLTKATRAAAKGKGISRTADCFKWPSGPGVLMLDLDMPHTPESARADILEALKLGCDVDGTDCVMVWRPSSSNGVYVEDPSKAKQSGRIYMVAKQGGDIKPLGQAIETGLWAMGKGHIRITNNGKPLTRCLVDTCVWQAERLDYVAPAVLVGGAQRLPSSPVWWNPDGGYLPKPKRNPKSEDLATANKRHAIVAAEPDCKKQQKQYIDAQIATGADRLAVLHAVTEQKLTPGFKLKLEGGTLVDVGEILSDPTAYHKLSCYDPFEPSDDGRVAVIYTDRSPMVYSQMHNGTYYKLQQVARTSVMDLPVNLNEGSKVLEQHILKNFKEQLFLVKEGNTEPRFVLIEGVHGVTVLQKTMRYVLSLQLDFYAKKGKSGTLVECQLSEYQISALFDAARCDKLALPRLRGVVNRPWLNPVTGIVQSQPGYDPTTQLYLSARHVFEPASPATMLERYNRLIEPFNGFQIFNTTEDLDRKYTDAHFLAAVLSSASRATIKAPALAFSCANAGAGKTYAAQCIFGGIGIRPTPLIWGGNETEHSKLIGSAYDHNYDHLFIDNADGIFTSIELNTILDKDPGQAAAIRRLGGNDLITAYNNLVVVLTGIKISFATPAEARRFLLYTLEPANRYDGVGLDNTFPNPLDYIQQNWTARHMDCLQLMLDYAVAGFPRTYEGKALPETFKSYPEYDRWVVGLVWHLTGVDVVATLREQVTVAAQASGVTSEGLTLTAMWLYCVSRAAAVKKIAAMDDKMRATLKPEELEAKTTWDFPCVTGVALMTAMEAEDPGYDRCFFANVQKFIGQHVDSTLQLAAVRVVATAGVKNGLSITQEERMKLGRPFVLCGKPLVLPPRLLNCLKNRQLY